jgi:predicted alpha/beta-hydrolase family hydrolase
MTSLTSLSIAVDRDSAVSALATVPDRASACMVFAHGAGAGMNHPAMAGICTGLAARGIATVRYQFPYMEKGSRRPDPPKVCHQTVRSAAAAAHEFLPALPLIAGGKSFGGRMTSQAQALAPIPHVRGLCLFGFPLHTPKQASTARADHLSTITIPMLFLQGTRDALAEPSLMRSVVGRLSAPATLKLFDHADHAFHVLVRSGTTDTRVMESILDEVALWVAALLKD